MADDACDLHVCKQLHNLPCLRQNGFQVNQRLLEVGKISHDCIPGQDALHQVDLTAPAGDDTRGFCPALR